MRICTCRHCQAAGHEIDQSVKLHYRCCICNGHINRHGNWMFGHNAEPVEKGRCCDTCNSTKVIPARIKQMTKLLKRVRGKPSGFVGEDL